MRITAAVLDGKIATVNRMLGIDEVTTNLPGRIRLYRAYGTTMVHRVVNDAGAVETLLCGGTAREVALFLDGMIAGLRVTARA